MTQAQAVEVEAIKGVSFRLADLDALASEAVALSDHSRAARGRIDEATLRRVAADAYMAAGLVVSIEGSPEFQSLLLAVVEPMQGDGPEAPIFAEFLRYLLQQSCDADLSALAPALVESRLGWVLAVLIE